MTLDYLWMLPIALAFIVAVMIPLYFILRKRWTDVAYKHYYANTNRLVQTPEYQSLMRKYKIGLMSVISLLCISLISLLVISAKPVVVESSNPIKYNRDIVLCLDASGSMASVNVELLDKFSTLVNRFKGERISLVIFNSVAHQVFPLTDDYDYIEDRFTEVKEAFEALEQGYRDLEGYDIFAYTITGQGASLIGDGVTACTQSFDNSNSFEHRSRSIILATDNLLNGEPLIPLNEAADIAIRDKIKVHTIFPPYTDFIRELIGISESDFALAGDELRSEMQRTGGMFFNQADGLLIPTIVDEIEKEQATAIESKPVVIKTDTPDVFIWLTLISGLLLLVLVWRLKI